MYDLKPQPPNAPRPRRSRRLARLPIWPLIAVLLVLAAASAVAVVKWASPQAPEAGSPTVDLRQVDGGPSYYARFEKSLPSNASYFPIAGWLRPAETQSQIDKYKDFGLNVLVGVECPECANEELLRANGIRAIIQANERTRFDDLGAEVAGWLLTDEPDMMYGPGDDPWTGVEGWNTCDPIQDEAGECGYTVVEDFRDSLPHDGRVKYNNYGKGVLQWETEAEASRFINGPAPGGNTYQQIAASDYYWFTDPNARRNSRYGLGSSYGDDVRKVRRLDAMDDARMPVWHVVELGWPFTESADEGGRRILPDEIRSAVWHAIIAGARGINYFDHNFGPGTPGYTILGDGYADNRAMAKAVNAQIKALAPVVNSPFVTSGHSATDTMNGDVRYMVKWSDAEFYLFAGADRSGGKATFSIPCVGNATAVRLAPSNLPGEAASIPVTGGSFTDSFADKNAVHIYRIDGGSTCGLPAR